jgi:ribosome-binding factor A
MTARTDRFDELFRQEINAILTREVDDPKIGFATITGVETQPDLRHAKVTVSVIGPADQRRATIVAMGKAMPLVRHELGKRLRMKRIPEFHLELDETLERGTRVLRLLDELELGHTPDDLPPVGESLPTPVQRLPHLGDAEPTPGEELVIPPAPDVRRRRAFRTPKHRPVPGRRPR